LDLKPNGGYFNTDFNEVKNPESRAGLEIDPGGSLSRAKMP
jgi:hypothetical protein